MIISLNKLTDRIMYTRGNESMAKSCPTVVTC